MKLEYRIIYSRRKSLELSVERDASIVVRAPEGTPESQIRRAVEAKKLWIFEKTNHEQKYPPMPRRKEFVSGESILYLGRHYQLEVKDADIDGVQFRSRFFISRKNQSHASTLFRNWYMERAIDRIPARARHLGAAMGVRFKEVFVSNLKVRWGSCTPRANLNFNWRIMRAPVSVIDYLIAHELAHLIEPNHTPRFWNIVSVQVPRADWARQWLREHGHLLEVDF
jgi:hypothetical protein